jgi:orotate phosphoribosyltransferase
MSTDTTRRDFIHAALGCGALRLGGPFALKSGALSPYFFDTSRFDTGAHLVALASAYAATVMTACAGNPPAVVFGPAYKGIPLAAVTAAELYRAHGVDAGCLFDRKEPKGHGEHSTSHDIGPAGEARQRLVGRIPAPGGRLVLLDDVITTGGTKYEAIELLRQAEPAVAIVALVVALDRKERDDSGHTAAETFTRRTGIPVFPIVTAPELLPHVQGAPGVDPDDVDALAQYIEALA